jgi:hypothetical protein
MTLARKDVLDLTAYERVREQARADVIVLKNRRRVALGDRLSLLFENRETVLFQIHEMVRTERLVAEDRIQAEIDAYRPLLPGAGDLSATLFIEIPELSCLKQHEVRETVNRFQWIHTGALFLEIAGRRIPARFETGQTHESKMAAVHYVRFAIPADARAALGDPTRPVRLVADHADYRAQADLPPDLRTELVQDLED